ncbi:DUF2946 domain-containing protein [Marinomonas transparens]|uniref:DUF2946 domain-containing protein n=1 Tax=Marinomonas transparens TaxID=2795388 RepID=A0A934MZL9_9GAMM|nr:DUF2946 domain-containing protein [Marinomonas transparens]MBJ7537685.1 DUF2946 domain-containing protein [Marinomonas transparens]
MHLQLKRPYNTLTQLAVFVCLFAVLIIYFAPLFSQVSNALTPHTQPASFLKKANVKNVHIKGSGLESMTMAGYDHTKMLHHEHSEANQNTQIASWDSHQGHHIEGESINVMEACGYCSLLFHLNWLDVKSFEIIPITLGRYPNVVTTTITRKCCFPLTSATPRAPPIEAT